MVTMLEKGDKPMGKLQAAAKAIKPPPDQSAKLADVAKLEAQVKLVQAAIKSERYGSQCDEVRDALSPRSNHLQMLDRLISMTNIGVEQHTGGKSGDAYESQRNNRLMQMAVKSLLDSKNTAAKAQKTIAQLGRQFSPFSPKTRVSELDKLYSGLQSDLKALKELQKSVQDIQASLKDAAKPLAGSVSNKPASA